MKIYNDKIRLLIGFLILGFMVASCIPDAEFMGDAAQTLVKLYPAGYNKVLFALVDTSQTVAAVEVRRDPGSEAALNSSTAVILKFDKDTLMIKEYNNKNGTYLSLLPSTLYTSDPPVGNEGNLTINFEPGEFVKSILIKVSNVLHFDLSIQYALAYKLVSVSGTGYKGFSSSDTTVVEIGVKNVYEGWYHSVGFRDHPTAGVFTVDDDKYLSTVDQYTVETYTGDYIYYRLWITIDPDAPLTNNVTIMSPDVMLSNNDPSVYARNIPGGYNRYDPISKTYYLYYYYNASAPRVIEETITKKE
jgi:hypothetical protein